MVQGAHDRCRDTQHCLRSDYYCYTRLRNLFHSIGIIHSTIDKRYRNDNLRNYRKTLGKRITIINRRTLRNISYSCKVPLLLGPVLFTVKKAGKSEIQTVVTESVPAYNTATNQHCDYHSRY